MTVAHWVEAARPRTLSAAIAPVLVGTAAATTFVWWRAALALTVALSLQVAVNFANDYFDAAKGVDTSARVGPRRLVSSGLIAPERMKSAMTLALLVAAAAGIALAAAAGWELLIVGALAIAAALAYSGGPRPYASAGLGEMLVFIFFGLVATVGSAYVNDEVIHQTPVVAAVPIGLLASAILLVNNLRDIDTDSAAGKVTLAVRIGRRATVRLYGALIITAMVAGVAVAASAASPWPAFALVAVPFAIAPINTVARANDDVEPALLIVALSQTARLLAVFAVGLTVGLVLAR